MSYRDLTSHMQFVVNLTHKVLEAQYTQVITVQALMQI